MNCSDEISGSAIEDGGEDMCVWHMAMAWAKSAQTHTKHIQNSDHGNANGGCTQRGNKSINCHRHQGVLPAVINTRRFVNGPKSPISGDLPPGPPRMGSGVGITQAPFGRGRMQG